MLMLHFFHIPRICISTQNNYYSILKSWLSFVFLHCVVCFVSSNTSKQHIISTFRVNEFGSGECWNDWEEKKWVQFMCVCVCVYMKIDQILACQSCKDEGSGLHPASGSSEFNHSDNDTNNLLTLHNHIDYFLCFILWCYQHFKLYSINSKISEWQNIKNSPGLNEVLFWHLPGGT
jgi:hypothetical protein